MSGPCLIVTRPAEQAATWVHGLRARGWRAEALPLLAIGPAPEPAAIAAMARALQPRDLVMYVSPNAVKRSMAAWPPGLGWPDGVRAAATGPGTVAALRAAGVPAQAIVAPPADAATFDSEALWAVLRSEDWSGRTVWIVRGEGGRDWFGDTLGAAGARVHRVQGYRRGAPQLDAAGAALLARALAEPAGHLWLFSSAEAIDHLQALAPAADWSAARALASHPRILARAQALGFGAVGPVDVGLDALDRQLRSLP